MVYKILFTFCVPLNGLTVSHMDDVNVESSLPYHARTIGRLHHQLLLFEHMKKVACDGAVLRGNYLHKVMVPKGHKVRVPK